MTTMKMSYFLFILIHFAFLIIVEHFVKYFQNRPPMDYRFYEESVFYCLASFATFVALQILSSLIFNYLILTGLYRKLSSTEQSDWNSRIVSTIHALIATGLSAYCFLYIPKLLDDILFYQDRITRITVSITIGYLAADLRYLFDPFDKFMFIHHIVGCLGLFLSAVCYKTIFSIFIYLLFILYIYPCQL